MWGSSALGLRFWIPVFPTVADHMSTEILLVCLLLFRSLRSSAYALKNQYWRFNLYTFLFYPFY